MLTIKVRSEFPEFYSPFTDMPHFRNGKLNDNDPSLMFAYLSEVGEFELCRLDRLKHIGDFDPYEEHDEIDILVELESEVFGSTLFLGYANTEVKGDLYAKV